MEPQAWGPGIWNFIHTTAVVYPTPKSGNINDITEGYYRFFDGLTFTLPCCNCRKHFKKSVEKDLRTALTNKTSLFKWTVDVHNAVNRLHGKKIWTYQEAYDNTINPQSTSISMLDVVIKLVLFLIIIMIASGFHGISMN